eukprot:8606703-Alexandrium_andersonii.AAC.1
MEALAAFYQRCFSSGAFRNNGQMPMLSTLKRGAAVLRTTGLFPSLKSPVRSTPGLWRQGFRKPLALR